MQVETTVHNMHSDKALLLLLPVVLLALISFMLDPAVTPALEADSREYLLHAARIVCPCLSVMAAAAQIRTQARFLQLCLIIVSYLLLILATGYLQPQAINSPGVCVISASAVLLFTQPQVSGDDSGRIFKVPRLVYKAFFALLMTIGCYVSIFTVLRQIQTFVIFTFSDTFNHSLLSMIFAPIYLMLQALGFHTVIGSFALMRYQDEMINAFINSILVTDFITVPAVLLLRALCCDNSRKLLFVLTALCALMTGSLGSCMSLILLLMIALTPGSFGIVLATSLVLYIFSYVLGLPSFTNINNLYSPDVDLSAAFFMFLQSQSSLLLLMGILFPALLIFLSVFVRKEHMQVIRQRRRVNLMGLSLRDNASPDMTALVLLRALGGISNILSVSADETQTVITVKILDKDKVQPAALTALSVRKPVYRRTDKTWTFEPGAAADLVFSRLSHLTAGQTVQDSFLSGSRNFKIRPMPHIEAPLPPKV